MEDKTATQYLNEFKQLPIGNVQRRLAYLESIDAAIESDTVRKLVAQCVASTHRARVAFWDLARAVADLMAAAREGARSTVKALDDLEERISPASVSPCDDEGRELEQAELAYVERVVDELRKAQGVRIRRWQHACALWVAVSRILLGEVTAGDMGSLRAEAARNSLRQAIGLVPGLGVLVWSSELPRLAPETWARSQLRGGDAALRHLEEYRDATAEWIESARAVICLINEGVAGETAN